MWHPGSHLRLPTPVHVPKSRWLFSACAVYKLCWTGNYAVLMAERKGPIPVMLMVRELDQGGIERDVTKIATHLDRTRFTPHVATFYPHGLRYEELIAAGIPILDLPVRTLTSFDTVKLGRVLRNYIRQHDIQVVHAYDASGVFGMAVAQLAGVPVVIGSQLSHRNILDRRTQLLLRLSDRYTDAMLVNCEAMRDYLIQSEGIPARKIWLCYNGVDTTQFNSEDRRRPEQLAGASLVIGAVCVLRPEKNLKLLQEAFALVLPLDPGMQLVIVGSGPELPSLTENAARLGIAANTLFVPASRDVAKWMRGMDIFVLPSYSEAFSNSLLEAMACGCAVVGSDVGGMPELIGRNQERGRLFESGNVEELAVVLTSLIQDSQLRAELGEKAATHAKNNLSIEKAAEVTGAKYEELLAKTHR